MKKLILSLLFVSSLANAKQGIPLYSVKKDCEGPKTKLVDILAATQDKDGLHLLVAACGCILDFTATKEVDKSPELQQEFINFADKAIQDACSR